MKQTDCGGEGAMDLITVWAGSEGKKMNSFFLKKRKKTGPSVVSRRMAREHRHKREALIGFVCEKIETAHPFLASWRSQTLREKEEGLLVDADGEGKRE